MAWDSRAKRLRAGALTADRQLRGQDLHRDQPLEFWLEPFEDYTEAALADHFEDLGIAQPTD